MEGENNSTTRGREKKKKHFNSMESKRDGARNGMLARVGDTEED